jgi:hypothetical protein
MKHIQTFESFLNETLFEPKGIGHNYVVNHKVGDELDLPVVGKCKVEEINFAPKKAYSNPWTATGKDFNKFEPFKIFPKATHSPQSIGANAIRLVTTDSYKDPVIMYQYESGGKVWTQYAYIQ